MPRPKTGGRTKGTPNKATKAIRTVFVEVFDLLQGDADKAVTLHGWARENPTEFYKLSAKLIPAKVEVGAPGDFDDLTDEELLREINRAATGDTGICGTSSSGIGAAEDQEGVRGKPN